MTLLEGESISRSPFMGIQIGKIARVNYDVGKSGVPSESFRELDKLLAYADIEWRDGQIRPNVRLSFPAYSNGTTPERPNVEETSAVTGKAYGDLSLPSVGDLAVLGFFDPTDAVVLGYLPSNYYQQTLSTSKGEFGTFRRIIPGEMLRQSKQQAEFFMDKAGAVHITVKDQSTDADGAVGGATTTKASAIDPAFVPTTEIAKVTIGETYTDDTLASRDVTAEGEKVVLRVKMASGTSLKIDSAGNVELSAAGKVKVTGSEVNLNSGEKGVAREDDEVKSVSADDRLFWLFLTSIVTSYNSHTHPGQGIPTPLLGIAPSSLTGKITEASDSVKAGD